MTAEGQEFNCCYNSEDSVIVTLPTRLIFWCHEELDDESNDNDDDDGLLYFQTQLLKRWPHSQVHQQVVSSWYMFQQYQKKIARFARSNSGSVTASTTIANNILINTYSDFILNLSTFSGAFVDINSLVAVLMMILFLSAALWLVSPLWCQLTSTLSFFFWIPRLDKCMGQSITTLSTKDRPTSSQLWSILLYYYGETLKLHRKSHGCVTRELNWGWGPETKPL